jgi:putative transcriptional regulator
MEATDLTGHLLLAMPGLPDPNFADTAVYLCSHGEEGSLGVVLNQPTDLTLAQVLAHLGIEGGRPGLEAEPVLQGGPVQTDQGFVLHSDEHTWEGTVGIRPGVALTSSPDVLEALAHGEGPGHYRLVLGYAGWGAGQLESELSENSWLAVPADADLIFDTPYAALRETAASRLGVDLSQLVQQGGHA